MSSLPFMDQLQNQCHTKQQEKNCKTLATLSFSYGNEIWKDKKARDTRVEKLKVCLFVCSQENEKMHKGSHIRKEDIDLGIYRRNKKKKPLKVLTYKCSVQKSIDTEIGKCD